MNVAVGIRTNPNCIAKRNRIISRQKKAYKKATILLENIVKNEIDFLKTFHNGDFMHKIDGHKINRKPYSLCICSDGNIYFVKDFDKTVPEPEKIFFDQMQPEYSNYVLLEQCIKDLLNYASRANIDARLVKKWRKSYDRFLKVKPFI